LLGRLPKFYYKPILEKVQEAYLANAHKDYQTNTDIESKVVLVIEADSESEADAARIGFIDIRMWELYQVED
jgi:hypothetical protein